MIRFYLKASPNFKGILRIQEWYEFDDGKYYDDNRGGKTKRPQQGMVDDSIRNANREQYDKWRAYIDKNDAACYEAAREEYLRDIHRALEIS